MKQYIAFATLLLFSMPSLANDDQKIDLVKKIHEPITFARDVQVEGDLGVYNYADSDLKRWIRLGNAKGSNCYDYDVCYCYDDPDVRFDGQDPPNLLFYYSISPEGHVNVEIVAIEDNGKYYNQRNRQYKISGSPGYYEISDILIQEENGNWSSWKQGFKDCYAGRK